MLLVARPGETAAARNLALLGAGMETAAFERKTRRIGIVAEPYTSGRGGTYVKAGKALTMRGVAGPFLGRRAGPPAYYPARRSWPPQPPPAGEFITLGWRRRPARICVS